jgi:hypothetical protein
MAELAKSDFKSSRDSPVPIYRVDYDVPDTPFFGGRKRLSRWVAVHFPLVSVGFVVAIAHACRRPACCV